MPERGALGVGQVFVVVIVLDECLDRGLGRRGRVIGDRLGEVLGRDLAHHHVRVGATESEAGDAGDGMTGVARPVGGLADDLQVQRVELDVRVGSGVVQRRRELVLPQCQHAP